MMRALAIATVLLWPTLGQAAAFIARDPVTHELVVQHECEDYATWMQRRCVARPGMTLRPGDPACQDYKALALICPAVHK